MKIVSFLLCLILFVFDSNAQTTYWNPVASGTNKKLLSVSFGSPTYGFISGVDSLLLRTVDSGKTWSKKPHTGLGFSLAGRDIIHLNFITPAVGFAVVGSAAYPQYLGTMYKTIDSGASWTVVVSGNIAVARSFFFNENNGYQIGSAFFSGHTVMKVSNGSWGNYHSFAGGPPDFLYGIDFLNTNTGIVGGTEGYVYRTFNAGVNWDTVRTLIDTTIRALKFLNASTILGVSDDPMSPVIVSHDSGRTWQTDPNTLTFFYPSLKSLVLSAKDSFIAVGYASTGGGGLIMWHGQNFINTHSTSQPLYEVSLSNDSIAFAVGDSGLIVTNRVVASLGVSTPRLTDASVMVYPNPSSGLFSSEAPYSHAVRISDIAGRVIYEEKQKLRRHAIDLSRRPKGVYLLEIITEHQLPVYRKLLLE